MRVFVIQNCETEGIGYYENYLKENGINYQIFHAYKGDEFPPVEKFDVFIVGGTPVSAYEFPNHQILKKEWEYLKRVVEMNKPYFGICCGGQLLAMLLGAKVKKNPVMEIGGYDVKLTPEGKKDPFFKGFHETFPVFHWHGDTFGIPNGAKLLVEGNDCKNQVFRYNNSIAIQFHLEIGSNEAIKWAKKYPNEPRMINKSVEQVVEECRNRENEMKKLSFNLMENFFNKA